MKKILLGHCSLMLFCNFAAAQSTNFSPGDKVLYGHREYPIKAVLNDQLVKITIKYIVRTPLFSTVEKEYYETVEIDKITHSVYEHEGFRVSDSVFFNSSEYTVSVIDDEGNVILSKPASSFMNSEIKEMERTTIDKIDLVKY